MQAASDISGTSNAVFHTELRVPEKSAANLDYLKKRLLTYFAVCDRQLQGRDFLTGELSVADLMLYPNFAARKALLDEVGGLANLQRWGAAMAARPGRRARDEVPRLREQACTIALSAWRRRIHRRHRAEGGAPSATAAARRSQR